MAEHITATELRNLLNYDPLTGVFTRAIDRRGGFKAGDICGTIANNGYVMIRLYERGYLAHRLAWLYSTGALPYGQIDHIDGNKTNNAFANLRDVSARMNQENRVRADRGSRTGLLGAYKVSPNRYRSTIKANGKVHYLGLYRTAEEAHKAYIDAKRCLHQGCTI